MWLHVLTLCLLLAKSLLQAEGAVAETLIVGVEKANNMPFEYFNEAGTFTGFHTEVVRAVAAQLEWDVVFKPIPWKRAMHELEFGEVSAVSFVAHSRERERFAYFLPDNILHVSRTTLYIRRDRADEIRYVPPLEAMVKRWRIAAPSGYYMNDEIVQMIRREVPIEQPTVTQVRLFDMLLNKRYDAIFGSTSALARAKAEIPGIEAQVQRLEGALFPGKAMYVAFSRNVGAQRAKDFADSFRRFKSEPAYRELAERFGVTELLPDSSTSGGRAPVGLDDEGVPAS